jgi:hypothetical protein
MSRLDGAQPERSGSGVRKSVGCRFAPFPPHEWPAAPAVRYKRDHRCAWTARPLDRRDDPKHRVLVDNPLEFAQWRPAVDREEWARAGSDLEITAQDRGTVIGEVLD